MASRPEIKVKKSEPDDTVQEAPNQKAKKEIGNYRLQVDRQTKAFYLTEEAAEAKWWCTELQKRTVDRCVQLHGGYGYMLEYPIARAYLDARVTTIYGGTTEIMKGIIGRKLARG